ncbi:MAG: hypothetical protein K6U75_03005 [Firmicutes bacterium]|nr:hypothetical protein [Bacillota bacterium]
MASPLKREVSPVVAVVVVVVVLGLIFGAYWYLTATKESDQPARPLQPPPSVTMPQGAGAGSAPSTAPR